MKVDASSTLALVVPLRSSVNVSGLTPTTLPRRWMVMRARTPSPDSMFLLRSRSSKRRLPLVFGMVGGAPKADLPIAAVRNPAL